MNHVIVERRNSRLGFVSRVGSKRIQVYSFYTRSGQTIKTIKIGILQLPCLTFCNKKDSVKPLRRVVNMVAARLQF